VTVSVGVTSYNVIFAPICLGLPTIFRGPSALSESPARRAVRFPRRTIGGRAGWILAYPEAGETFSALSLTADAVGAAATLLSLVTMLGREERAPAFPDSATRERVVANVCSVGDAASVATLFSTLF
jgi:hypothetical protein